MTKKKGELSKETIAALVRYSLLTTTPFVSVDCVTVSVTWVGMVKLRTEYDKALSEFTAYLERYGIAYLLENKK